MAKNKSSKKNSKTTKEFSSSPFKSLKGLSAFAEPKKRTQKLSEETRNATHDLKGTSSEQESFADEMDFLGVKALPDRIREVDEVVKKTEVKASHVTQVSKEESELATFLDAVGSVEKVFKDEWPEHQPVKRAVPRRMKQVERGQLQPEDELDLHGLSVEQASVKIEFFLQDAIYQGFQTVLIITGKGLHSSDGPVLRLAMERLLDQSREQVIEWGIAPKRYGGNGALVVFLRKPAKE